MRTQRLVGWLLIALGGIVASVAPACIAAGICALFGHRAAVVIRHRRRVRAPGCVGGRYGHHHVCPR
jgi:hypothetical protein